MMRVVLFLLLNSFTVLAEFLFGGRSRDVQFIDVEITASNGWYLTGFVLEDIAGQVRREF